MYHGEEYVGLVAVSSLALLGIARVGSCPAREKVASTVFSCGKKDAAGGGRGREATANMRVARGWESKAWKRQTDASAFCGEETRTSERRRIADGGGVRSWEAGGDQRRRLFWCVGSSSFALGGEGAAEDGVMAEAGWIGVWVLN